MKILLRAFLVLLILALLSGIGAWYFLPKIIAHSVTSESGIQFIPPKVKLSINETVDRLPASLEMNDTGLTIDDVIEVVDKATVKEITATIDELENTDLKDEKQVLDIIWKNANLYKLETEKTKKLALEKLKMSDVHKILKMIRENGKPYALTIPMAKETIKGILLEKKKKIEAEIN